MSVALQLFFDFSLLSFVAFGGATALLPEIHRVVVEHHHWLDDATFAHLYAIAQAAPGIAMLAAFACVAGGVATIRRGDRRKGALMLVMAVVLVGNVLIWTM